MNRRRLILTALGALAAGMGLPKVALAAAAPKPKVPIAQLYIDVSQDVSAAVTGLGPPIALGRDTSFTSREATVAIGSLIISDEAEMLAFLKSVADAIRKAGKGT